MWSDPEEIAGWAISPRGAGYLFGASVTQEVREVFSITIKVIYFRPILHAVYVLKWAEVDLSSSSIG